MRKEKMLFVLGVWVVFMPFLGFPNSWRKFLFFLTGICIIYIAYLFYKQNKARIPKDENVMESFVDNIAPRV
jgi:cbb3-type cytochrome oxidase subunit 3